MGLVLPRASPPRPRPARPPCAVPRHVGGTPRLDALLTRNAQKWARVGDDQQISGGASHARSHGGLGAPPGAWARARSVLHLADPASCIPPHGCGEGGSSSYCPRARHTVTFGQLGEGMPSPLPCLEGLEVRPLYCLEIARSWPFPPRHPPRTSPAPYASRPPHYALPCIESQYAERTGDDRLAYGA